MEYTSHPAIFGGRLFEINVIYRFSIQYIDKDALKSSSLKSIF